MNGTGFSSLPVFTCFNCDKEFRLRVMLHAHQKECCSELNSYKESTNKHNAHSKKEFCSSIGLKPVNANFRHSKFNHSTNFHFGDIIVIDDDDEEDEDSNSIPTVNNTFPKLQKSVAIKDKCNSDYNAKEFLKVRLRNKCQKLLTLDLSSPLGRRVDFKTSFEKKKQTCTVNGFPLYEKWCLTIPNEVKGCNDKYAKTSKNLLVRKYNFRQKRQYKKLSKAAEELKLKMKVCSVNINRIVTNPNASNESFNMENQNFMDTPFSSDDPESVIRKVYSLALNPHDNSLSQESTKVVSIDNNLTIDLGDTDNDDCYVCEVEPSNRIQPFVKTGTAPKSPHSFSFLCRICDNVVECSNSSQENMREHYAYVHKIFNVNLVPYVVNGKTIWKLVETYNPIVKKLCINGTTEDDKGSELLNSSSNRTIVNILSPAPFSESLNRRHYLGSKSFNYQNFSTDVICID